MLHKVIKQYLKKIPCVLIAIPVLNKLLVPLLGTAWYYFSLLILISFIKCLLMRFFVYEKTFCNQQSALK